MKKNVKSIAVFVIILVTMLGSVIPAFAANELPGQALGASGVTQNLTVPNPWGQYSKYIASNTSGMYKYEYFYKTSYYVPVKQIGGWSRGSLTSSLSLRTTYQTSHTVAKNTNLSISLPIKYVEVSAGTSSSSSITVSATTSKTYNLQNTVTNFDPAKRYAFHYYAWVDHYLVRKTQVKNFLGLPITPKVISITDYYKRFKSPTIEVMWGY